MARRNNLGVLGRLRFWVSAVLDSLLTACRLRIAPTPVRSPGPVRGTAGVWGERLRRDLRVAGRSLLRRPAYALAATLALAMGIGATTAIYSVVDGVLLRPLAYPESDKLAVVGMRSADGTVRGVSFPNLSDIRARSAAVVDLAAARVFPQDLVGAGDPERLLSAAVSPDYLPLLGASLRLGRGLAPEDDREGVTRVGVISHDLWMRRWGGDLSVVGRSFTMNEAPIQIVGVLDAGFEGPEALGQEAVEVWLPLSFVERGPNPLADRADQFLTVVGRLAAQRDWDEAAAEIEAIGEALAAEFPRENSFRGAPRALGLDPLHDRTVGAMRRPLALLLGAVALLFLAGLINACNLILVRTVDRAPELGVRRALGAGRLTIVRLCIAEAVVLAGAAGVLGVAIAVAGVEAFLAFQPGGIPRVDEIAIDVRVLAFAVAMTMLAGGAVGALAAWRGVRGDAGTALRLGARATASRRDHRVRGGLVVVETAIAIVLLISAGLFINSFVRLSRVPLGYRTDNVVTMEVFVGGWYATSSERFAVYRDLMHELEAVPSVEAAGVSTQLPLSGFAKLAGVYVDLPEAADAEPDAVVGFSHVSPGYFESLGIGLLPGGRTFDERDLNTDTDAVVISRSLAARLFGQREAVGRQFGILSLNGPQPPFTVIGVVEDVRYQALALEESHEAYRPHHGGFIGPALNVFVRAGGPLDRLVPELRAAVRRTRADLPIGDIVPVAQLIERATAGPRFLAFLLTVFAATALAMTALGIYGTVSYVVSRRRRELGVRVAVGASPGQVMRMVMRRALGLTAAGVLLGLLGAVAMSRFLTAFLYGVTPTDVGTLAAVAVLLVGVHLVATYLPARQVTSLPVATTLRAE